MDNQWNKRNRLGQRSRNKSRFGRCPKGKLRNKPNRLGQQSRNRSRFGRCPKGKSRSKPNRLGPQSRNKSRFGICPNRRLRSCNRHRRDSAQPVRPPGRPWFHIGCRPYTWCTPNRPGQRSRNKSRFGRCPERRPRSCNRHRRGSAQPVRPPGRPWFHIGQPYTWCTPSTPGSWWQYRQCSHIPPSRTEPGN
jgi:hypothetical protein